MGDVLGAGLGQNVARQMSVHAGLPEFTPAFAINKVCGSGFEGRAVGCSSDSMWRCRYYRSWWCRKT